MPGAKRGKSVKDRVLELVAAIPPGRVATYGDLARRLRLAPRQVAGVLARLSDEESETVAWHRIVGSGGFISTTKLGAVGQRQIDRLRREGISVKPRNLIDDYESVRWVPSRRAKS
jgi:methylated-DNA-protein-cysteine methyltransferase-like protein